MFPSSVRRVVSSAPQTGLASSLASTARAAATTVPVFVRGHQRRYSSSKPSKSDNGSSDISTGQSVAASGTSRNEGKTNTEKRKRKSKVASEKGASFKKLPSVPSTHHMSQEGKRFWQESGFSNGILLTLDLQLLAYRVSFRYIAPFLLLRLCREP